MCKFKFHMVEESKRLGSSPRKSNWSSSEEINIKNASKSTDINSISSLFLKAFSTNAKSLYQKTQPVFFGGNKYKER